MRSGCSVLLLLLTGCDPGVHLLAVDVRTDLRPGAEFDAVEVQLDDEAPISVAVDADSAALDGLRAASWPMVDAGSHRVEVRLMRRDNVVLARPLSVELDTDSVFTVRLTRDCVGVECGADDLACLAGRCVAVTCSEQTVEGCGEADCAAAADCLGGVSCAVARCEAGVCLYAPEPAMCAPLDTCDLDLGCRDGSDPWGDWTLAADDAGLFLAFAMNGSALVDGERFDAVGDSSMFVQGRTPDGGTVLWTRRFGEGPFVWPLDATMLASGELVLGGAVKHPETFRPLTLPGVSEHDAFLAVLNRDTGDPIWAIAATVEDEQTDVIAVAATPDGHLAALLEVRAPATLGGLTITPTRMVDFALAFFEASGPSWTERWVVPITGGRPRQIAASVDAIYVAGEGEGAITFGGTSASANDASGFVGRVQLDGTVDWITILGVGAAASLADVAVDNVGRAHAVGAQGLGDAAYGGQMLSVSSASDVVVVGLEADGSVRYASAFGGAEADAAHRVVYEPVAEVLVWAATSGAPFDFGGATLGDAGREVARVLGRTDDLGAAIDGALTPAGAAPGEWPAATGLAVSGAARCVAGPAPSELDGATYRGSRVRHLSCEPF